ncbi:flagellar assembly peptidoglycan hydrolase FlgJ [Sphaerotilus sp.]|uniref:flagellar assembly peptidoglycan hydrolase FlgJ n=1 Tax=Sphaerotilus sp. TaxID=2093942 RepID=UPI00286D9366|nr:flagellar assembly peptidoglycan hydrolase FlgJ [Sphaerotilus sp.]
MQRPSSTQQLAAGGASLDALRGAAARNPADTIKEVSRQFEALFMQELMKSMRATTMDSGMLSNSATAMGGDMLDQQYAMQLSGQPGGLAAAIARQLERQMGVASTAEAAPGQPRFLPLPGIRGSLGTATGNAVSALSGATESEAASTATSYGSNAQQFVATQAQAAAKVSAESGIPADFMLAQAAHETGWGRREIRGRDGSNSHNLFGIKAGAGWNGPTVTTTTTEVIDGEPRKVQAQFRAYGSYEESFRDYARLIGSSPRYASARRATDDPSAFARELQRAGYATDPDYAAKLTRVIQTTQRLQRSLGRAGQFADIQA